MGASMFVKRCFDLLLASITAPLWLPLLFVVGLLVRSRLGSPVFFHQERPGRDGKSFKLIKFRSMTDERDAQGQLLPDADRLPAFGRWLRATSLDEFPELLNILKGEMSFVGPRPLLMQYLPLYSREQARRHETVPGITGWAQVNGRNALSWNEKFSLDVWYVDNRSLWLDIKILWKTFLTVVRKDGIQAPGEATMPFFKGDEPAEKVE
jgi:lipopolysaccharide/colanic/teichoic acid biosynthesis glycosyltransferase